VRFGKSRDGFAGQWGPFNFEEVPAGDYQVRVTWHSERAQCFDESTRQMRKLTVRLEGLGPVEPGDLAPALRATSEGYAKTRVDTAGQVPSSQYPNQGIIVRHVELHVPPPSHSSPNDD
jgi:hypothetical protein